MKNKGFSIIEMLVVVVIFTILAYFVTQSSLQVFRSTEKVDASGKVRDNLEFATSLVERRLRNAKEITDCPISNQDNILYVDQYGQNESFRCETVTVNNVDNTYLASGSAGLRVTSSDIDITSCSFSCSISSPINPPVVYYTLSAVASGETNTNQSLVTLSRRVVLRVY